MIRLAECLFWAATLGVVYTYFGYPLLLSAIAALNQWRSDWRLISRPGSRRLADRARPLADDRAPSVAVLVSAFNEQRCIGDRIANLLAQDYPASRLRIYVGSDASSDRTAEIVRGPGHAAVTFVEFPARRGKASVINDLVAMATEDVLVFTDANTHFEPDAVSMLVRGLEDRRVGCVCGELRLVREGERGDNQDHLYWRYERMLKFYESRIGGLLGANGGVYALRREAYVPVPANTIVDDFWISMQVVEGGLRCAYAPEAVATESVPERVGDEFGRRVRIGTGNYQSLARFARLLDPRRGVATAFTFFSHKVLRWLAPHLMVIALACNVLLATLSPWYAVWLLLQTIFYAASGLAWRLAVGGTAPRLLRLPLFFVSMNVGLLVGFWRYSRGAGSGAWTRTVR